LAFSECEAAELLGIEPHSLREARRKGAIRASRIVNRRVVYAREDLLRYLAENRINDESPQGLKKATA
jgi:predicted site-specific integrase-resolvase